MASTASRIVSSGSSGSRSVAPIHWGLLASVAGAHAAGLFALYGGIEPPRRPAPTPPPTIAVRLIEPSPAVVDQPSAPQPAPLPHALPPRKSPAPAAQPRSAAVARASAPAAPPPAPAPVAPPPRHEPAPELPAAMAPPPAVPEPRPPVALAPLGSRIHGSPAGSVPEGTPVTVPASADAAYLRNPAPAYPPGSRRRGEEGRVVLRIHVLADGNADAVEIAESSGHPRLDTAAQGAVRHWRFSPARRADAPVDSWLRVPIVFRLDDS